MSNWIGPTVKQLRNYAMHVLHNFLGFNTNTTAFCLGRSSLHLLLLKSSMADPNHYWWNERTALLRLKQRILTMGGQDQCTASLKCNWIGFDQTRKTLLFRCTKTTKSKPVKLVTSCTVILSPLQRWVLSGWSIKNTSIKRCPRPMTTPLVDWNLSAKI